MKDQNLLRIHNKPGLYGPSYVRPGKTYFYQAIFKSISEDGYSYEILFYKKNKKDWVLENKFLKNESYLILDFNKNYKDDSFKLEFRQYKNHKILRTLSKEIFLKNLAS